MYENIKQTLSFYNIDCTKPYYISLESEIFKFSEKQFRMDFYAFGICTAGEITLEIDNSEYTLAKNSLIISAPSTTLKFVKASEDYKMNVLLFEKNFLLKNISNPFILEKMVLFQHNSYSIFEEDQKAIAKLTSFLAYIEETGEKRGKYTDEIIRTIIFNLLLEVAEINEKDATHSADTDKTHSDLYLKFRQLVLDNILIDKSVQFYAKKLNVSNKYLIEIVKKSSEKTPHEIIDELLLKEAYVFLGDTELTISEIAFKLRFNSVSAFGRFFKKYASLSPSEYRTKENLIH